MKKMRPTPLSSSNEISPNESSISNPKKKKAESGETEEEEDLETKDEIHLEVDSDTDNENETDANMDMETETETEPNKPTGQETDTETYRTTIDEETVPEYAIVNGSVKVEIDSKIEKPDDDDEMETVDNENI
ncbi:hypothetical protein CHS0354_000070 [Potamilus streckersoni]|uniref:Uncharacterized protein n=1 Tax=Potamilus streckersoni TaxID=2493646 RepID=A0AAE0SV50_9BIVA|nr:hypothetical protein CHS0354_000070 [Potamilus streckersoni]